MPLFIDAADIAELLGLADRAAFLRRYPSLYRDHGFPDPMPHSRRPLRWRRDQVLAWIDEHGQRRTRPTQMPTGENVVLLKEAARA